MKRAVLILLLSLFGPPAEVLAAQCSSYYISEINIVPVDDTEAGHVQTYVGFGQSKEESEQKAMQACSHLRFRPAVLPGIGSYVGTQRPCRFRRQLASSQVYEGGQAPHRLQLNTTHG